MEIGIWDVNAPLSQNKIIARITSDKIRFLEDTIREISLYILLEEGDEEGKAGWSVDGRRFMLCTSV